MKRFDMRKNQKIIHQTAILTAILRMAVLPLPRTDRDQQDNG
jgi:hypothetical protein